LGSSFAGASSDFNHIIFESGENRTLGATGSIIDRKLYEWDENTLRLAGVLPNGVASERSIAGRGVGISVDATHTSHPISADGSRVNFTVVESFEQFQGPIYQRIEGRTTSQLNASELASPEEAQPATYWDASTDGDRVFFTSNEKLTEDASGSNRLYMWERQATNETQSVAVDASGGSFTLTFNGATTTPIPFDAPASAVRSALEALKGPGPEDFPPGPGEPLIVPGNVSVSGGPGSAGGATPYQVSFTGDFAGVNVPQLGADGSGLTGGAATATVNTTVPVENLTFLAPGTVGVIGTSDDGSYLYFVANEQLIADQSTAQSGLYLWHDGTLTYVGRLDTGFSDLFDGVTLGTQKQTDISADGRHLLFVARTGKGLLSVRGGSDYDHGPNGCIEVVAACRELYLYSADTDELQCVSCNPSGAPATVAASARIIGAIGGSSPTTHISRALSEDGRYVFFTTGEKLVAEDTNGIDDAYVYDALTDRASLLSSGRSKDPSYFLESNANGRDAFFATTERLSGWDFDQSYDLYDARAGGGFPEPPPAPPSCLGDACQPAPLNLNDPTPASSGFQGAGNQRTPVRKPRCGKGKRRVKGRNGKGRCVKRNERKQKRAANNYRRARR
jgi:hypothetical protein